MDILKESPFWALICPPHLELHHLPNTSSFYVPDAHVAARMQTRHELYCHGMTNSDHEEELYRYNHRRYDIARPY